MEHKNKIHISHEGPDLEVARLLLSLPGEEENSVVITGIGNTLKLAHSKLLSSLVGTKARLIERQKELHDEYTKVAARMQCRIELIEAWQEQDDGKYATCHPDLISS